MDPPIIETHNLRKEFKLASESVEALCGVDLLARRGEMLNIIGPSGSGKKHVAGSHR